MLNIDKINVYYGDLQILWDVSLRVDKGLVVTLVGSNGAGKTTLFKTIIGILRPKSGSITFFGKRIDNLSPADIIRLGIAQVPEGRRLFSNMNVLENLELGAYVSEARKKVDDTLDWVFNLFPILKERKNQLAMSLSGGEQQMLAIARGLMARPQLLMLDEPSLGLAPKLVVQVFDIIQKIKDEGMTILLIEQNTIQALALSDLGFVLETGRIVLEGAREQLLQNEHVKKAYLGV
ncbi:MAG: ABC transporter ATP-binding protein [Candidatus Hodarchaeota archaeon]